MDQWDTVVLPNNNNKLILLNSNNNLHWESIGYLSYKQQQQPSNFWIQGWELGIITKQ